MERVLWGDSFQGHRDEYDSKVSVATDNEEIVAVTVKVQTSVGIMQATGGAKRHPKDRFDFAIGYYLAFDRALRKISEEVRDRASLRGHALGFGEVIKE